MGLADDTLAFNAIKVLSLLLVLQLVVKLECETDSAWREAKVALAASSSLIQIQAFRPRFLIFWSVFTKILSV